MRTATAAAAAVGPATDPRKLRRIGIASATAENN